MQNHQYMTEGILHDTIPPESLQKVDTKDGEIQPHTAVRTDTYVNN